MTETKETIPRIVCVQDPGCRQFSIVIVSGIMERCQTLAPRSNSGKKSRKYCRGIYNYFFARREEMGGEQFEVETYNEEEKVRRMVK